MTDVHDRFGWPRGRRPAVIAHRGASGHAPGNTATAFEIAASLGAEMWEIDVRMTACGTAVLCHDPTLAGAVVAETTLADLRARPGAGDLMTLDAAIALADRHGAGLYLDLKDSEAGPKALEALQTSGFRHAALGAFDPTVIADLRARGCAWPLAVRVPAGADPVTYGAEARPDIVHLCWREAAARPDRLLTPDLAARIRATGADIVVWHEDRAAVIAGLTGRPDPGAAPGFAADDAPATPLLGICADYPERIHPWPRCGPRIVCHRGFNAVAPENTLAAARAAWAAGYDVVEIDVRQTRDGRIVVMHDPTLDRTTDGAGPVAEASLAEIQALDAGSWFSPFFSGTRVPSYAELLAAAGPRDGLYCEIKAGDPKLILAQTEAAGMLARTFFWSSDTDLLRWLRRQSDAIRLMAGRTRYPSVAAAQADYAAQIVEFDAAHDDLSEVPEAQALGAEAMIYTTARDPAALADVVGRRADLINCDAPHIVHRLLVSQV